MTKEEMEEPIFSIIASAGECRGLVYEAINLAEQGKIEEAKGKFNEAEQAFLASHKVQTSFINAEASGNEVPFSMLFMHAEDHLMTASSELSMAKKLVAMLARINQLEIRLSKLEG